MNFRKRMLNDLDQDIRDHIERETQDNIDRGMPPDEARFAALRKFGNVTRVKEDTREVWILRWLEDLLQDLRFALRMLRKNPGFAAVAILTLALGIGANVALFTVVQAILLNPLPFAHPEQLVHVYDDLRGSNASHVRMSVPEFWDLRDKSGVFENISALGANDVNLTGSDHPERIQLQVTSTSFFTLLGAQPQLGRVYTKNDEQPGFIDGVVLSDGFWRRTFGGDPGVIGKKIRLDSDLYTIIGVMPREFHQPLPVFTSETDVWTAAGLSAPPFPTPVLRSRRMLSDVMARLKLGLTIAQAQARLNSFSAALSQQYPVDYPARAGWALRLVPVQEVLVGNMRTELLVLFGAVAFVLLIACVNLANLLLARSAGRQREIAVRLALGAGRLRVIRQMLAESVLLSTVSGAVALVTVLIVKTSLLRLAPLDLPRAHEITLSPDVLLFALFASIFTGVFFGLVPALQTARPSQIADLREGSRGSGSSRHQTRISRVLVASEIALSLVLLIGAGLLLRSFWHLLEVRPGFEPHQLMTAKLWLPFPNDPAEDAYRATEKRAEFYQEVLRRVSMLPGVEQAAAGSAGSTPLVGAPIPTPFVIESHAVDSDRAPVAAVASVSSGYFDVLKTPLIKGRVFTDADNSTAQQVVVINEAMRRRYWHDEDPIGQRIKFVSGQLRNNAMDATIVGIVGDIKSDGLDVGAAPYIYVSMLQVPYYGSLVYLRGAGDPRGLGEEIRREVQSVDPQIPVFSIQTMEDVITKNMAGRHFALELFGAFAAVAFLLASIGIYGVMAYTFSRRVGEIGLRMALGAQRSDILKLVLGEGASIVIFGVLAGLIGSVILTRFLQTMLFDVKPTDPITFGAITILLSGVALLACLIPAQKASRVDPLVSLRHE
ncbi:MAG: ABC transporter permease [Candidatus Acidiferrales bacterium]